MCTTKKMKPITNINLYMTYKIDNLVNEVFLVSYDEIAKFLNV